ncbi:MAG: PQQ-binding-like beta-propeller repeat protein [Planctomycetota bacterium]
MNWKHLWFLLILVPACNRVTPVEEISIENSGILIEEIEDAETSIDLAWSQWRGGSEGVASNESLPTKWSESSNVRWSADIPGRGHSSPIVVGDLVVVGTATKDTEQQWVIAYDREDGRERWKTPVHTGGFPSTREVHRKATNANGTVASDGNTFVVAHLNSDRVWVTGLNVDGEKVWQTDIGAFRSKFGYAPSPVIYKSLAIVAADNGGGGYLVGIELKSGKIAWRVARGTAGSYSSPAIISDGERDQVVITGGDRMASYDPTSGELIWETPCIAEATCGTIVSSNGRLFASGGYPDKETVAISTNGELLWSHRTKIYEPSLIIDGENIFAFSDDGIAYCWSAEDGKTNWKKRVGGKFSGSPVLSNGLIYVADLSGNDYVIRASGEQYEMVAKNQLGDDCYASPAIAGDAIIFRVGVGQENKRKEKLYCIAAE